MGDSIRIRTDLHDGVARVRTIIAHPMETGFSVDPETGTVKAAHFIREVECLHGERLVLRSDWSRAVSRNPYLAFEFSGAQAGDRITIRWQDNRGASDSATVAIGM